MKTNFDTTLENEIEIWEIEMRINIIESFDMGYKDLLGPVPPCTWKYSRDKSLRAKYKAETERREPIIQILQRNEQELRALKSRLAKLREMV